MILEHNNKINIWHVVVLILYALPFYAQNNDRSLPINKEESGWPFIQNYTPEDYRAFDQNWAVTQDSIGIMYFANGDGVLIYDGSTWKLIPLPNNGMVRGVVCGPDQRIYVCGTNEFGYLDADSIGQLTYHSLSKEIDDKSLGVVYGVTSAGQKVFFRTKMKIIEWDGLALKIHDFKSQISCMSRIENKVLIALYKEGIFEYDGRDFNKIIDLKESRLIIRFIAEHERGNWLLGTEKSGLYLSNRNGVQEFVSQQNEYLRTNRIKRGIVLRDSTYAFATLGGIVIVDRQGKLKLLLNQKDLLTSQKIYNLFQDRNGILWASMDFGISKIEYPSRFTVIDHRAGLEGVVMNIKRHQNELYIATEYGLSKLSNTQNKIPQVEVVYDLNNFVYDLISIKNSLFFTTNQGLFNYEDKRVSKISSGGFNSFCLSHLDTNRIFVSYDESIRSMYKEAGKWVIKEPIEKFPSPIYDIKEMENGDLWLETDVNSVFQVQFKNPKSLEQPLVKTFSKDDGLPNAIGRLFTLQDELYYRVIYGEGVYKLDKSSMTFHKDTSISLLLNLKGQMVEVKHVDEEDNLWFNLFESKGHPGFRMVAWKQDDGSYEVRNLDEERIYNLAGKLQYPEPQDKVVWYLGKKIILRHDLKIQSNPIKPYHALIRSVKYQMDSTIFAGHIGGIGEKRFNGSLSHKNNSFRFEFSSTSFFDESINKYQYYLEGYETDWSDWTTESKKEYTNLSEGDYTFHIRADNILNQKSIEDTYAFVIASPWYRSWWAYLLYFLSTIMTIYLIVALRSRRLLQEKLKLEQIVSVRTEELQNSNGKLQIQKVQLANQTEELKEMDQVKSRLFANISHEFRTPLTLIKGPLDQLIRFPESSLDQSNIHMMHRNSDRLLRLVNQMLDLSKLDSGNLPLNKTEGNLFQCIRTAASSFSSLAAHRNLDYRINIPAGQCWANFDRDKLEKIIYNLLSNAFKFTADEGSVAIRSSHENSNLQITVTDTGQGIPVNKQSRIFDRFYQVDNSSTKDNEGTGIGLALVKELVELMDGSIHIDSTLGKGTTFYVTLSIEEIKNGALGVESRNIENLARKIPALKSQVVAATISASTLDKVLLVEDNQDMRTYIAEQLNNQYTIVEAVNGTKGFAKALEIIPDLIITDLMMPDMDGLELCKILKSDQRTSHIPVVMLTAKAGLENKLEGLETGADFYLTKPFEVRELEISIKNLINQRKKLRELFSAKDFLSPKDLNWSSMDQQFLQKLLDVLEKEHDRSDFGVPELQVNMNLSKAQLHRKLKALTDQAPGEFIRNFRLKRAAQILIKNSNSVTQTAYAVGFNNLSYFAKCFKEVYGVKPSEYLVTQKKLG